MPLFFAQKVKIVFAFLAAIIVVTGVFVWKKYPFGVKQYKTIALGMQAAEGAGTYTVWAPPDDIVRQSLFYVYALNDEPMCLNSSCGMGGLFIECLGGWLSGDIVVTEEFDYDLADAGVDMQKQRIITVADKNAKIVGIYPGARIKNLPYIMRNHRDLFPEDYFKSCMDLMPSRWK